MEICFDDGLMYMELDYFYWLHIREVAKCISVPVNASQSQTDVIGAQM